MKNTNQKGFTLIELLTTITIMVLLLSLVLANFGANNQKRNLNIGRNVLVSDLHKTQSLSIASKDISPGHPASAYAITFDKNANNKTYTLIGEDNSVPANRSTVITSTLPANTYVKSIVITRPDGSVVNSNTITVYFLVPYARLALSYDGNNQKELNDVGVITLSTADNSNTLDVTVNGVVGNISSQ